MADENQELRRVSWTELFSFTHIFKTWKMAKHYSKLLLAFVAIALICLVGHVMDNVWRWGGSTARTSDVYAYFRSPNRAAFAREMDARDSQARDALVDWRIAAMTGTWSFEQYQAALAAERGPGAADSEFVKEMRAAIVAHQKDAEKPEPLAPKDVSDEVEEDVKDVWNLYLNSVNDMLADADDLIDTAEEKAEKTIEQMDKKNRAAAADQLDLDVEAAERALWKTRVRLVDRREEALLGRGVFSVLAGYEQDCIAGAFGAVRRGNIFTGVGRLLRERTSLVVTPDAREPALAFDASTGEAEAVGLLGWIMLMIYGPLWLFSTHWFYAIFFGVLSMAIWAVFGGAIARIAALHAAREEAISISQALRFSISKFVSFFTAPVILVVIILVLGILLGIGGLIMTLYVGDLIMSILFVIALVLGAAITFVSIGLIAGGPLMYPTIAVEGSDSFDAISRSFSYVFSRPWRYGLYTVVAAVYGTACYLFVRVFAYGTLLATHTFVARGLFGLGANSNPAPELAEGAGKLDLLWGKPTFDNLAGTWNGAAMGTWYDSIPAGIIRIWVYVVVGLVAAFVVSFTISAFTNIYYLLRRKVDATDLDDVYIEEFEEPAEEAEAALGEPVEPAPEQPAAEEPEAEAEEGGDQEESTEEPKE